MWDRWQYWVASRSPWSMTTLCPPPPSSQPATMTRPSAAATTVVPVSTPMSIPACSRKTWLTGVTRIPNTDVIRPDILARELAGAALSQAAPFFLFLLCADQRLELAFGRRGLLVELVHLGLNVLALRVRGGEQLRALMRETVQRDLLLTRLRFLIAQLGLRAQQPALDREHLGLIGFARANRALVRLDQEPHVVPALDEVAARARAEQDVDVAEIAVLVGVDEPAREHVLVALERLLRGGELDAVPVQFALRRRDAALYHAEAAVDRRDVPVGVREFGCNGADLRPDHVELCLLLVALRVDFFDVRLLGLDLVVDVALAVTRARHERDYDRERSDSAASTTNHVRRCLPTLNHDAIKPTAAPTASSSRLSVSSLTRNVTNASVEASLGTTWCSASASTPIARPAPSTPASIPSAMNGIRMYMFVAPTSCMIAISRRRAKTVSRIVLAMTIAAEIESRMISASPTRPSTVAALSSFCTVSAA